jgi:hypothetical protein
MTFEEFFKKKRVDLTALEKAEPALFYEFKTHFEQMGEKSFDHTKKYWFNKTRRQYPLAPEVKTEKPQIANPIAEQTITESLTETVAASPLVAKVGFTPKFRAANMAKPVVEDKKEEAPAVANEPVAAVENVPAKPAGFVPRFKMKPKVEAEEAVPSAPAETPQPTEATEVKPAYVPKFKMKPKVEAEENATPPTTTGEAPPAPEPVAEKKPAYKPRFVPPKPKE